MKCMVTGASGFLGGELAKSLAREGHKVYCPVRRPMIIEGCETFIEEYRERELFKNIREQVEVVFNCVGKISDCMSLKQLWEINVALQEKIIRSSKTIGANRFIHISSTSAGGLGHKNSPISEEDDLGSGGGYGNSKREGEKLVQRIGKEIGIEVVVLRPTLIYGAMKEGSLEKIMLVLNTPIRMLGTGKQIWHMVHVDDLIQACKSASTKPGIDGMIFNIAGPEPKTAKEIVVLACDAMGYRKKGIRLPGTLVKVIAFVLERISKKPLITNFSCKLLLYSHEWDITRAVKVLDFSPHHSLAEDFATLLAQSKERIAQ